MSFTKTQAPILANRERNGDEIIAMCFVQGTRLYTAFPQKDDYARFILSSEEGADTCNELLYGDCATFLDIDCPLQLKDLGFSRKDFVKTMNEFLIMGYKTHLGLELREHQILWCTSTSPEKTSFHIIIKNPEFAWRKMQISTDLRTFVGILADETLDIPGLHYFKEKNGEIEMHSVLDTGIYHNNRCFRTLQCRKDQSPVRFQALVLDEICPVSHSLLVQYMKRHEQRC